jgi:hypothetical protein
MFNRNGEKVSDLDGIEAYEYYGITMPMRAKYIRNSNRIYFENDPKHGETMSFFCCCDKPSRNAIGNAYYWGEDAFSHLVNVKELEPIE